ncbi:OpgC domain-containing protein [Sphingomonas solaris]|nr:OpgC domain-containing protein [Sphingomonas solaris]
MRLSLLDGFRGFFLIMMMIVHADETLDTLVGKLNHHAFGWVEDAQGFIFISGLVVGLVYSGILERRGYPATRQAMNKRCWTIYKYHAGLTILIAISAVLIGGNHDIIQRYIDAPVLTTIGSLALFSVTSTMGILPMYLIYMLCTPWVLRALRAGELAAVVGASVLLWLLAQSLLPSLLAGFASDLLIKRGLSLPIGSDFNLFGWQVVFLMGLIPGYLLSQKGLDLSFLRRPSFETAFYVSLIAIVFLGIFDRLVWWKLISPSFTETFVLANKRSDFGGLYTLAFVIDLYVLTWLLSAGSSSNVMATRKLAEFLRRFFSARPLIFLGQHSLQVFAFHIAIVYALGIFAPRGGFGEPYDSAIIAIAALSLFLPAKLHEFMVQRDKRKKSAQQNPLST